MKSLPEIELLLGRSATECTGNAVTATRLALGWRLVRWVRKGSERIFVCGRDGASPRMLDKLNISTEIDTHRGPGIRIIQLPPKPVPVKDLMERLEHWREQYQAAVRGGGPVASELRSKIEKVDYVLSGLDFLPGNGKKKRSENKDPNAPKPKGKGATSKGATSKANGKKGMRRKKGGKKTRTNTNGQSVGLAVGAAVGAAWGRGYGPHRRPQRHTLRPWTS